MRRRAGPLVLTALVALGCGGDAPEARSPRSPLSSGSDEDAPRATSATWRYHPAEAAQMLARAAVPGEGTLFAGQRGERWLVDDAGRASAAARLAPEALVSLEPTADGRWAFVGQSGTRYESETPLGPFTGASSPVDELARLAVSGPVMLGIRRDGSLVRREGVAAWTDVGPREPRMVAVGFVGDTDVLGLALPEALWQSRDAGRTWAPIDAPPRGAFDLLRDDEVGVVLESLLGRHRWEPGAQSPLIPLGRAPERAALTLRAPVPLGPSASALNHGRAVISGGRYRELRPGEKVLTYDFVEGRLGGPLERRRAAQFDGCRVVRFAKRGPTEVVACGRTGDAAAVQPIELYRSEDDGLHFVEDASGLEGSVAALALAVGRAETTLVAGVCAREEGGSGCRPSGLLRRTAAGDAGGAFRFERVAVPGLEGAPLSMALSSDGARVVLLGVGAKSGHLAVFASDARLDGFRTTELSLGGSREDGAVRLEGVGRGSDGGLAFVVRVSDDRRVVVVDDAGHLLAEAMPPADGAAVGAAGSRALALVPPRGEAWESLDAGATWRPLGRPPIEACEARRRCDAEIACAAAGCVIGDQLTRVGWEGQADAASAVELSPEARTPPPPSAPRVEPAYVCTLDAGEWTPLPAGVALPTADRSGFDEVDWFSIVEDPTSATVDLVQAERAGRGRVERVPLLPSVLEPEAHAMVATLQVEGAAALRYRIPETLGAAPRLADVEVAWVDLLAKRRGRAHLRDGGAYHIGDYERGSGGAQRARPALLSIASGGVYVRLHAELDERQPTYFSTGGAFESIDPPRWPGTLLGFGRGEMAHVGAAHVALRLSDVAVGRMVRAGAAWTLQAEAVGFRTPAEFGVHTVFDVAYVDGQAGLHVTLDDVERGEIQGFVRPFSAGLVALGPPVAVPTQSSLGPEPRRCSESQRAATPRIVAPYHPGTRHPVIVSDPLEPVRVLLTDRAVLHGTPSAPCAVTFDAEMVSVDSEDRSLRMRAILPLDHLEGAWLVRAASAGQRGKADAAVEYHKMRCRLDPSAPVPAEVYRANGTMVR